MVKHVEQIVELDGLAQHPGVADLLGDTRLRRSSVDNDWCLSPVPLTNLMGEGFPIHHRHVQIEQNRVGLRPLEYSERHAAVLGARHLKAVVNKQHLQCRSEIGIVLHDENTTSFVCSHLTRSLSARLPTRSRHRERSLACTSRGFIALRNVCATTKVIGTYDTIIP